MTRVRIRPELREAIARAILDDDASGNGEHLYDGERLWFYCPLQAPEPEGPADGPRIPVRELLPAGSRIPSVADFLAETCPGVDHPVLSPDERRCLGATYDAYALGWLLERLPESVTIADGA